MPDAAAVTEENLPAIAAPPSVLDELRWRGLVALTTDEDALAHALAAGPITAYCGFDPTAPSLHFGNLVQLIVLRHLQRAGHRVICLVGGSTGLIGDPRPTAERVLKTKEQTAEWVDRIQQQVRPFLDFDGDNPAIMVNNLDWTAPMSALDFLRDIGKHFRVNTMMRKDAVAARLNSDEGISYTEFSYQILQGLDYLHLFREYGCTLQTGGQDQWGNLTAGTDLIRRADRRIGAPAGHAADHRQPRPEVRQVGGQRRLAVGRDDQPVHLLPVLAQRGGRLRRASAAGLHRSDGRGVESLERELAERPQARTAQRTLAGDVTTLVHGAAATQAAIVASAALFGRGDLAAVDEPTLRAALTEAGLHAVSGDLRDVAGLFVASGLVKSLSEARRVVAEGGEHQQHPRERRGSRPGAGRTAARPVPRGPPGQAFGRRYRGRRPDLSTPKTAAEQAI